MTAGIDFVSLKYQTAPHLIIEECLKADNPTDEIEFAVFALTACGHKQTADKVWDICPQYGLAVGFVEMETRY